MSKQVSRMPLYASAPIAYDGTVYARIDGARWSRDCTLIKEFLGLKNSPRNSKISVHARERNFAHVSRALWPYHGNHNGNEKMASKFFPLLDSRGRAGGRK